MSNEFIMGGGPLPPDNLHPGDSAPVMPRHAIPQEGMMPERGVAPSVHPMADQDYVMTAGQPPVPGPREHLSMAAQQANVDIYGLPPGPVRPHGPPPHPMPAPYHSQAIGQAEEDAPSKTAIGLSLLAVVGAAVVGHKKGGAGGAAAVALIAGGAINALRASRAYLKGTEVDDKEGRVAATYSVAGLGAGGYLAYRFLGGKEPMKPNADPEGGALVIVHERPGEEPEGVIYEHNDCDIRPVGP